MMANENFLKASTVRKLKGLLALAPMSGFSFADAADFFNSGAVNQTVGWDNGSLHSAAIQLTLKTGKFEIFQNANGNPTLGTYRVEIGAADQSGFQMRVYTRTGASNLYNAGMLFNGGQTWGSGSNAISFAFGGRLTFYKHDSITDRTTQGPLSPQTDRYLLFEFQDAGDFYYGWVQVNIANEWVGSNPNNYITVLSYAWQKGIIQAGATAVPEPSTVVTSGIAALAGGALALRRWRKERKTSTEAA
ncbi:PEP-CTERM sorting domain-containing protein [bacterium]|nr:PEP-CTERM sorting domain-containing protein [bacterium]